jgi:hypothetical protein
VKREGHDKLHALLTTNGEITHCGGAVFTASGVFNVHCPVYSLQSELDGQVSVQTV